MERKLASIQKVQWIKPIENADKIELIGVLGWQVIVKKEENLKPNDLVVYFEIDSILPETEWSEFMRPRGFRLKTVRLRGSLSQGLVLPISILGGEKFEIDQDVTELLGVKKYEPPPMGRFKSGQSKGNFPTDLIHKTDEIRVQSAEEVLYELKENPYYMTVKLDGTSATYLYCDDEFTVCSRNQKKKEDDENIYWKMAYKYDLSNKLLKNIAIQGEIVGPTIQKNKLGLKDINMYIFNVWDINEQRYYGFNEFIKFCENLKLKTVPIEEVGSSFYYDLKQLLEKAEGKYSNGAEREGIVIRPQMEMYSKKLRGRLSFKAINNKFLLKHKE